MTLLMGHLVKLWVLCKFQGVLFTHQGASSFSNVFVTNEYFIKKKPKKQKTLTVISHTAGEQASAV